MAPREVALIIGVDYDTATKLIETVMVLKLDALYELEDWDRNKLIHKVNLCLDCRTASADSQGKLQIARIITVEYNGQTFLTTEQNTQAETADDLGDLPSIDPSYLHMRQHFSNAWQTYDAYIRPTDDS
jgi:hypothetical protein